MAHKPRNLAELHFMKILKDLCACVALLGIAAAGFSVAFNYGTPRYVADKFDATLSAQLAGARGDFSASVSGLGDRAETQIALTRDAAVKEVRISRDQILDTVNMDVAGLAAVTDHRLASIQEDGRSVAAVVLAEMDDAVQGWAGVAEPAGKILENAQPHVTSILATAHENSDLLGKCATQDPDTGDWIGNPDCLANRVIPVMKNAEQMMGAIARETPATAKAVREGLQQGALIATDVRRIGDRIAAPPSLAGRIYEGVKLGLETFIRIF